MKFLSLILLFVVCLPDRIVHESDIVFIVGSLQTVMNKSQVVEDWVDSDDLSLHCCNHHCEHSWTYLMSNELYHLYLPMLAPMSMKTASG